jgi:hypothetical protein
MGPERLHHCFKAGAKYSADYCVLLDNQSCVHIFCNLLLLLHHPIKSPDWLYLRGIVDGPTLKTNMIGSFRDIAVDNVWYSKDAVANILSLNLLHASGLEVAYSAIKNEFTVVTPSDGVMVFEWDDKVEHYLCDLSSSAYSTIADNLKLFSKRESRAAVSARNLMMSMGFMSNKKTKQLLQSGNMINEASSQSDVDRVDAIFGKDGSGLTGKSDKGKPTSMPLERPRRILTGAQSMSVDILFARSVPYLLSVTKPLAYIMIEPLTKGGAPIAESEYLTFSRDSKTLQRALYRMLNAYRAKSFPIEVIQCDNESGFIAIEDEIEALGISVLRCGPGQHVALVEHKIKIVKRQRRCHIYHVPFALTLVFELFLMLHCVWTLNFMPTSTRNDHIAPFVDFAGRKIDRKRDVRFIWGDLCHAVDPNLLVTNGDAPRTNLCVLLLSTGNLNGSVQMMNLATWQIITRDKWTVIPYDQVTIQLITAKALSEELALPPAQLKARRAKSAVFRRVHGAMPDDIEEEPSVDIPLPQEATPKLHGHAPEADRSVDGIDLYRNPLYNTEPDLESSDLLLLDHDVPSPEDQGGEPRDPVQYCRRPRKSASAKSMVRSLTVQRLKKIWTCWVRCKTIWSKRLCLPPQWYLKKCSRGPAMEICHLSSASRTISHHKPPDATITCGIQSVTVMLLLLSIGAVGGEQLCVLSRKTRLSITCLPRKHSE